MVSVVASFKDGADAREAIVKFFLANLKR